MFKQMLVVPFLVTLISPVLAEVTYPKTRNAVGPGEHYLLGEFRDWSSWCVREENAEDLCYVDKIISDLDAGIELDFIVQPRPGLLTRTEADVDVVPRAFLLMEPFSEAEHYHEYTAKIVALDGEQFDGYWCPLTDSDNCFQGPELDYEDTKRLYNARVAEVVILEADSSEGGQTEISRMNISLKGLRAASERSLSFQYAILGIDPNQIVDSFQIETCTFRYKQGVRHITYLFDEDHHVENTSFREIFRGPRNGGDCPSYASLANLTPETTAKQRELFCLVVSEDGIEGVELGERDAYRRCKEPTRTFCEVVNDSTGAATALIASAGGVVVSGAVAAKITGLQVVSHSSGAAILSGSGGYIAGTLGAAASVFSVLTAPLTGVAATVTIVAVGGVVYVCR